MSDLPIVNISGIDGPVMGVDIGSTTAKVVLIEQGRVVFESYERHYSQVRQKTFELIKKASGMIKGKIIKIAFSGSAGLGLAKAADIQFVQEVFATKETIKALAEDTSVVIELGGEDAKVVFFEGGVDERMNGSCAGGTGAFIDQMATLLDVSTQQMDELSLDYKRIYPIASRCGVFAKTDIQPLLNQGARKEDIAVSVYQAVVDQTIVGLTQGHKIQGKVMFLGGPLYYCKGLRDRFVKTLGLTKGQGLFPEYGRYAVAIGAAIYASKQPGTENASELLELLERTVDDKKSGNGLEPLFTSRQEYDKFLERHNSASLETADPALYRGRAYLGVDCGSTTTKLVLITEDRRILYTYYSSNRGNPVKIIKEQLETIYKLCGRSIRIASSAVTGYGEELILNAFHLDGGIVETMAHYNAARYFNPSVDFILDIGGQDIKCFKIHNRSIDSILLNEACSSGCGSFIETFAVSMGYGVDEFSKLGLFSSGPVDLGSRCTVFMNSSVKQAQKDGADVSDISAGLSISVVKNAIYKVIRANSPDDLGNEIVVQGGTFLNDAVLRSFEKELGHNVTRPRIAGLMGAYGAALHAQSIAGEKSSLIGAEELANFSHQTKTTVCNGCGNHCNLTINTFSGNQRYISGNKCEKGAGLGAKTQALPNMYQYKRDKLMALEPGNGTKGTIGLPLALGMYEMAPFWHAMFRSLGFRVVFSGLSNRATYLLGQYTIPSDTACYPAKLMHGHVEVLLKENVDAVFYPRLTYNFDEKTGDNHYNCPVVAYYSELLQANMDSLKQTRFLFPYLNINDRVQLVKELHAFFNESFPGIEKIDRHDLKLAVDKGHKAYDEWMEDIRKKGAEAMDFARKNGKKIVVFAGRPYHIDNEIGHSIDKLATSLDLVVVGEDSVCGIVEPVKVNVLNQWTYHSRLYNAARYVCAHEDCELVQLVSFGCGIDAITTDEVRAILEKGGKLYTQIKIDEISNLGAVKIRLRSLLGALEERRSMA